MHWRRNAQRTIQVCLSFALIGAGAPNVSAATISVGAGADLQAAINAAQPGDTIALEAGATFTGNFVLPNKGASTVPILIRSAALDSALPPAGVRITPSYAAVLPKIKSPNTAAALRTAAGTHHWTLMFLEFQANYRGYNDIIALGAADSTQTSLSQVPHHLVLDRVYVHGDPLMGQKRCVTLNSSDTTVINSHVSDCKGIGQDAVAVGGWNGPGNYLIENNYLEGSTENILFGGADPVIPNLVTSNIVVRGNYVTKPPAFRNAIAPTPQGVAAVATTGSLPAGTYFYKVVARIRSYTGVMAVSSASTEVSATAGSGGGVRISWAAVSGATDYLVYGRASGSQNAYWTTTATSFTDTGAAGTSGTPAAATKWLVKNLFELKNAQDVTVEGNVFENVWVAGQSGYAIQLTPRNQDGGAPWAVVQRVTIRSNIIRHAAGGVNILGTDDNNPSLIANHITISHNVFDDLTSATWGTGSRPFQIGGGPDSVTVDHNTIITTQTTIVGLYGGTVTAPTIIPHLVYTNNMSAHNTYGIMGDGSSTGLPCIQLYAPGAVVTANVLAGGSASKYPTGNFFPTTSQWQAGFVNYATGNYHLLSSSPYKAAGTDGADLGANVDLVASKTAVALTGDDRPAGGGTSGSTTTITALTSSSPYPLTVGSPTTWTATASNPSGAVQYRFYVYKNTAWVMVQDYSASNKYTWTPQSSDAGTGYALQVWVRAVGSTALYDAWRSTSSFNVVLPPLLLTANVDFPVPPGSQVTWTAALSAPPSAPVEYRFQVVDLNTNATTVLRNYSSNNQAQWVPLSAGRFVVQCLERQVGSTAAYDLLASTQPLDVAATPLTITLLSTPTAFPASTGTPITWTTRTKGGLAGPIQFAYWLYSAKKGWRNAQPYGPTATFTWTPTWDDEDDFVVQVWVRSNGSTANYEAYLGTNLFHIQRASLQLTTTTLFPVAIGTPVTWTADVSDPSVTMEYKFWLYTASTSQWTLERDYSTQKSVNWTPLVLGSYAHQVWARQVGSTSSYDLYRSTGNVDVTSAPAQMVSLISNVPLPAAAGASITWTAGAIAGTAPLEYQFWRLDASTWKMVRDYSSDSTYLWITTAADRGSHSVQVRVRSIGSSAAYESQMTTGAFTIQ